MYLRRTQRRRKDGSVVGYVQLAHNRRVGGVTRAEVVLNLGREGRMNVPGRAEGNWTWRCTKEMLSAADFHSLRDLTRSSKRLATLRAPLTSEMAEAAS